MIQGSQREVVFKNYPIVIERDDVKHAVVELRNKWSIPPDGFQKSIDSIVYRDWLEKLTSQILPESQTTKQKTYIKELEFEVINGQKYFPIQLTRPILLHGNSRYSLFLEDIKMMCKRLKLASHWQRFFLHYIPTGKVIKSARWASGRTRNTPKIKLVMRRTSREDEPEFFIRLEFGATTKQKDVTDMWQAIEKLQKELPTYKRARLKKELERDLYMYGKVKEGKTSKEIFRDLPEEYYNERTSIKTIEKAIQRIKEQLKTTKSDS